MLNNVKTAWLLVVIYFFIQKNICFGVQAVICFTYLSLRNFICGVCVFVCGRGRKELKAWVICLFVGMYFKGLTNHNMLGRGREMRFQTSRLHARSLGNSWAFSHSVLVNGRIITSCVSEVIKGSRPACLVSNHPLNISTNSSTTVVPRFWWGRNVHNFEVNACTKTLGVAWLWA